jgi:uncharacterized protein (DUF58 family)
MKRWALNLRQGILKGGILLVLLLVTLVPTRYCSSFYGYGPFLVLVFLLLLSVLQLLTVRRFLSVEAEQADLVCQRGEESQLSLSISNHSILFCPKVLISVHVSNFFGGEEPVSVKSLALPGKSRETFPFCVKMAHIGVYTVGVKALQVYDMLGLFCITIPAGEPSVVTVLPRIRTEELTLEDRQRTESQNVRRSTISDGFDYTGVRQYAFGDSMKRIHWKLSAHTADYMTKISEISMKNDLMILIDVFSGAIENAKLPDVNDCLVETALSLGELAMKKNADCVLLFADQDKKLRQVTMKRGGDFGELLRIMPGLSSDTDLPDGAELLEKVSLSGSWSGVQILCTANITEELLQTLIAVKQQQKNPILYYIVPPKLSSLELEKDKTSLLALDDYDIPYQLILAESGQ